jgi:hypothetical protein
MSEYPIPAEEETVPVPTEERRASTRLPSAQHATWRPAADKGAPACEARIREVSHYGIGLVLARPAEPGTLLALELEPPGQPVRSVLARVVHITLLDNGERVAGCAFVVELTDEELRVFQAQRLRPAIPDSRAWVRFPCNVETVCYSMDAAPGEQLPARLLNISSGGVGLVLPCQFESRTLLRLELPQKPCQPPRRVVVRVVQARPYAKGDWFLGCEFADALTDDEVAGLL